MSLLAKLEFLFQMLKGIISDPKFKKFTFSEPFRFFCIFNENFTAIKLPVQQFSWKQHIFGNRDNSLLVGINFGNFVIQGWALT